MVITMKTTQLEHDIDRFEKALRGCLAEVPFIQAIDTEQESMTAKGRIDILVKLNSQDREWILAVEVKTSGQPRLAREGINQLWRYREALPYDYAVLAAPYISPRTAEICSQEGVGYVDLAGNCRLSFGQVFIQKEGRPNLFAEKRDLRSLYSPKAERVLRVLLLDPVMRRKMESLAEEAEVSLGQVANVKKLLADREWIRVDKDGFWLSEPEALLAEWSENYNFRRNQVNDYYSLKSVGEIESELNEVCRQEGINYALSGFSGAVRVAPSVRYQRATAYADEIERVASLLNLKRVPSGANVTLLEPYDKGVFFGVREVEDTRVVSSIQLYLDLKGFRGRGDEAADAVLEEVIRPLWQADGQITQKT
ncbi:MAG: type IV toxin-antitoxin system AbiEi family antitoxin [Chloroflexi bacterium]|nr:type IV toxin-antitoxin system AbiEi family antitoxin [Chloroflexota bacterium]